MGKRLPAADGDDFSDICSASDCPVCTLWPAPGESDAVWLARLGRLYRAAAYPTSQQKREST